MVSYLVKMNATCIFEVCFLFLQTVCKSLGEQEASAHPPNEERINNDVTGVANKKWLLKVWSRNNKFTVYQKNKKSRYLID